jgi:predicted dehydrogenase
VAEVSQRSGKQVIEAFMYRFHPQFTVALDLIQAGAIGELRLIKSNFSFNLQRALDIRWDPALGGGVLYDVGCYCVSASRLFAGREAVQVWASADRTEQGVDYAFNAMMDFGPQPSGIRLRANFDASFRSGFYQRLELIGEGGNLLVAEPFLPDARFARRHGTHAPRLWLNGHELITEAADSYLLMLDDFAEAIAQASPARFPIGDTLRQMATLDALFAAAQSPQAQPIQTEVAP